MCCSDINTFKGGMVTVVKNYLESREWKSVDYIFVATHKEGSGIVKAVYFLTAYLRIMKLLLCHKVDMAHLHMAERGSFYRKAMVERLCHRFHIPVILHHHSAEFEAFYHTLSAGRRKWVKKALEEAELNLVLSTLLAEKYREKAPGAKIEVLYNAVNVPEENPYTGNASDIILLGKLGQRKGTYDFLQALKAADDKIPQKTKCYLCGDGETAGAASFAEELGIRHRIAYIGWAEAEKKAEFLGRAAIHVLPSYGEGLPMSILETMARGIPNISTDIASIPEVIENGKNGFLIQPGDKDSLAERMISLLNDPLQREEFSKNGFSVIQDKFTLQKNIRTLEAYYWRIWREKVSEARR